MKCPRKRVKSTAAIRRWIKAAAVILIAFASLGTVSALWNNRLFMRMTPAGLEEISLLAVLSVLLGLYVAIRRPACGNRAAGLGGVLGFIGVACPVCNKVLLLLFGGELLLTYFEPVRLYVAAAGAIMVALAIIVEWRRELSRSGEQTRLTKSVPSGGTS